MVLNIFFKSILRLIAFNLDHADSLSALLRHIKYTEHPVIVYWYDMAFS